MNSNIVLLSHQLKGTASPANQVEFMSAWLSKRKCSNIKNFPSLILGVKEVKSISFPESYNTPTISEPDFRMWVFLHAELRTEGQTDFSREISFEILESFDRNSTTKFIIVRLLSHNSTFLSSSCSMWIDKKYLILTLCAVNCSLSMYESHWVTVVSDSKVPDCVLLRCFLVQNFLLIQIFRKQIRLIF